MNVLRNVWAAELPSTSSGSSALTTPIHPLPTRRQARLCQATKRNNAQLNNIKYHGYSNQPMPSMVGRLILFQTHFWIRALPLLIAFGLYASLSGASARRLAQRNACCLVKLTNAAIAPDRPRPSGLTGEHALCVAVSRQATSMPSKRRLDCALACKPEAKSN